jgi:hypothetical protein
LKPGVEGPAAEAEDYGEDKDYEEDDAAVHVCGFSLCRGWVVEDGWAERMREMCWRRSADKRETLRELSGGSKMGMIWRD